jgi:MarR family 2-MHQ and catechol resistance regulon transcriptional repressor
MPLGEVQRRILVSSGGVTYLADSLESRGLVRREPADRDRRIRIATLTDEGREMIEKIFPEHAARLEEAMAGLSPEEQERAATLIRRLGKRAASSKEE